MTLTHFQKTVKLALDLSKDDALKVQKDWPATMELLQETLTLWKDMTNSKLPGLQILMAIEVIWQRRPTDLSEAAGRDILYHPISGAPIPERSTVDGLSWEMLAFLNWAYQKGFLEWTDEVTIIREIKASNGEIDQLPDDRFFAKHYLPRDPDGEIDWSNLELAKSKTAVTTGPNLIITDDVEDTAFSNPATLEAALLKIPSLYDQGTRNILLRRLPRNPVGAIRRNSAPSTDIHNIVSTVRSFGRLSDGRIAENVLIDNAMSLVAGTQMAKILEQFKVNNV